MTLLEKFETDLITTTEGDLLITFLGHGSLLMGFQEKRIYVDPFGNVADYASLPKADLILITHEHSDHFDLQALSSIRSDNTLLVQTEMCERQVNGGIVMHNGEKQNLIGIQILAVPAYNLVHKRPNGATYHPRGIGNGYILSIGGIHLYIAGDTENIPEMKELRDIDIAFLPMNLPYTMTSEMVADAAKTFKPHILYPYHLGDTDVTQVVALLQGNKDIEVRIRKMV
jgi:L-ascorbate metabolism protein UlaG (beta-lactamase superfamily)